MDIHVFSDGVVIFNSKKYTCALGKAGVGQKRSEGDNITPVGDYPLNQAYYRPDRLDRPKSGLDFQTLTPKAGWCDDPADIQSYNQFVTLPHAHSHESLWRNDEIYDLIAVIGYNSNPIKPGLGSAVFIHLARPGYTPTEGCVALSKPDLLEILEYTTPKTRVVIHAEDSKS